MSDQLPVATIASAAAPSEADCWSIDVFTIVQSRRSAMICRISGLREPPPTIVIVRLTSASRRNSSSATRRPSAMPSIVAAACPPGYGRSRRKRRGCAWPSGRFAGKLILVPCRIAEGRLGAPNFDVAAGILASGKQTSRRRYHSSDALARNPTKIVVLDRYHSRLVNFVRESSRSSLPRLAPWGHCCAAPHQAVQGLEKSRCEAGRGKPSS